MRVKIAAGEEIGLHRDAHPTIVVALQGGTVTRLEADARAIDVVFPTGVAVYRAIDPPKAMHRTVNNGADPVEVIMVELLK